MPFSRSSDTCAECRVRKVKCGGRRETCSPCERLRLRCSFQRVQDGAHVLPDPEALSNIRRARKACRPCQDLKVRCSGDLPRCQRCASKKSECVYPVSKRSAARCRNNRGSNESPLGIQDSHNSSSGTSPSILTTPRAPATPSVWSNPTSTPSTKVPVEAAEISPLLDEAMVTRILESFFQYIQPIPVYSFLHKASLVHRFETGLINPALLLALIGTTCEMIDMGISMKDVGKESLLKAEAMVVGDVINPSALKIQTLILMIQSHCRQGKMTSAFMLLAIASRFAYALRLNHEAPKLSFIEQESRRRLMWSLFILDTTLAGGIREFSLCSAESMHIQLPCQERNFELDLEEETEFLRPKTDQSISKTVGSLGFYIRILWLRHRILQATKEAVLSQANKVDRLPSEIERLASELTDYEASLPQSLRFSERNLQLRAYSPRLCSYLMLHMWWRQCYCDLYRVVLTGLKEALGEDQIQRLDPSIVRTYRWKCYESAERLSNFLASALIWKDKISTTGSEIPVCAYQSVRLLLRCYQQRDVISDGIKPDMIQHLVRQCLSAVELMPVKTPVGQRIVSNSCTAS